ncbi:MAG: hypothetical protein OEY43_08745 [Gammaproteobacteria bacterium]|nr:hypothetical protein [Gammaproteobacteria bacterium]
MTTANYSQHTPTYIILLTWFSLILLLGLNQNFIPEQGVAPVNLLISAALSISLFLMGYWRIARFRDYILNIDMRLLVMLHSWRMLGMGFVMLYMLDKLPPLFAFVAGFGDAATAIAAVFLAYALFTRKQGVPKKLIRHWNTFGLIDFIVAVTVGVLTQTDAIWFAANGISSDIMVVFPFVLIPGFLVQLFTITHIIIYLQLHNNHPSKQSISF